jgi:hypothetical protein
LIRHADKTDGCIVLFIAIAVVICCMFQAFDEMNINIVKLWLHGKAGSDERQRTSSIDWLQKFDRNKPKLRKDFLATLNFITSE